LSAGLKQLAATALLWAMKEVPGHEMPVVIDTPLGRIDRENQENMLLNYYPHLSHQVIILPTNAEIDHRKRNLIINHVAQEYVISNETGDAAHIRPGSLLT
jgi:DNA sulfur modification protein DndD